MAKGLGQTIRDGREGGHQPIITQKIVAPPKAPKGSGSSGGTSSSH